MKYVQRTTPPRLHEGLEAVLNGRVIPRYVVVQVSRLQHEHPDLFEAYQYAKAAREVAELPNTAPAQAAYKILADNYRDSFKRWAWSVEYVWGEAA